jgi:Predicted flavoprotein
LKKQKILLIVGSMRRESFNRQLAMAARRILETQAEVAVLNYADIPYMNQDIEFPAPEPVVHARELVKEADGLWIFTPEYNHSIPGVLKNLLDWLSRTLADGEAPVVRGKKVTYCGAGGASGTACVQDHLLLLLNFLEMDVMKGPRLTVPLSGEEFKTSKLKLNEMQERYLRQQADRFLEFTE